RLPHFYAVASYGLQHPGGMNHTAQVVAGLRAAVADVLDGRATLADVRRGAREELDGPTRAPRRAGDPEAEWHVGRWPGAVAAVPAPPAPPYPPPLPPH